MESFVCPACQSVVSAERREAHETTWCPALPATASDDEEEVAERGGAARLGGVRAMMSPLCQDVLPCRLGSWPALRFELEQRDIFGPLDTGGALWYADRVMGEFVAGGGLSGAAGLGDGRGLAMVLGSGGVPLSGLVASALGWDVVMTDLEPVLELTRANVERSLGTIREARAGLGLHEEPSMRVSELYFADEPALSALLAPRDAEGPRPLAVLCSDCIWRDFLHRPLLATVASALGHAAAAGDPAVALVCFQTRSPQNEAMFMKILREEFTCFEVTELDVTDTLAKVCWPSQVSEAAGQLDLPRSFPLLRMVLRPGVEPPLLSAEVLAAALPPGERKPWW